MTRADFLEGMCLNFRTILLRLLVCSFDHDFKLYADLDRANIISIDVSAHPSVLLRAPANSNCTLPTAQINHDVRPDSMLILQAARDVVDEDGFDDLLDSVRARIDEIESLHRTRELTVSDFFTLALARRAKMAYLCSSRTWTRVTGSG